MNKQMDLLQKTLLLLLLGTVQACNVNELGTSIPASLGVATTSPTATPTGTPVHTSTPTPTPVTIPTATPTPAHTPTPTPTPVATPTPMRTPTPTPTPVATPTATPTPVHTPTPTPAATITTAPSSTPTTNPAVTLTLPPNMTIYLPVVNFGATVIATATSGSITSASWKQITGPTGLSMSPNGTWSNFSGFQLGTYVLRFTATNSSGASSSANMILTVLNVPDTSGTSYGTQIEVPSNYQQFAEPSAGGLGYYAYLPPGYAQNPTKTYPLLLFLHGTGQTGNSGPVDLPLLLGTGLPQIIQNGTFAASGSKNFIVISPQTWGYFTADIINNFMAYLKKYYRVDTTRTYITGLSYGAMAIWDYIQAMGSTNPFAAMVTISGNGHVTDGCQGITTPLWAFHGENDTNGPTLCQIGSSSTLPPANQQCYERSGVALINACNPIEKAKITLYPGYPHNAWDITYNLSGMGKEDPLYDPYTTDIYTWMLNHHK